jgi:signal peptide peptidase SppA
LRVRGEAIARMSAVDIDAAVMAAAQAPLGRMVGSVAVIPVAGCITQKSDFYSWWYGGTSVERLTASFRQYANDPSVTTIVFDCDSPGGEVYGVQEFAEEILAARGSKKTIAVTNPFMASAALWLLCSCDEMVMLPSGQVGSIGVYSIHTDMSAMLAQAGVKMTVIKHGEHKAEDLPYEPLSEDAHAEAKACVDFYGNIFDKHVAKSRGTTVEKVRADFGQGRMLRAPEAKKLGLVDRLATLDQVLAKLAPTRMRSMAATSGELSDGRASASFAIDGMRTDECSCAIDPARCAVNEAWTESNQPAFTPVGHKWVAKKAETVETNDDGTCPDGYELRDGMCYLSTSATTADASRRKADEDLVAVALAATA